MEAYVDDMLVKSRRAESHSADLEETLAIVRKHDMRIHLAKCTFGVKARKFLGYMATERGIEVNQLKVRAIQEISPPRTLKEAQTLMGRIIALTRFVSRLAK